MPLVPELILIALLIGWLSGGRFWRLAEARIRYVWLIFVPLGLYIVSWAVAAALPSSKLGWLFGTMAIVEKLALIVVALANRRLPGVKLILAGIVLNLIALCANCGMMPADPNALDTAFGAGYAEEQRDAPHVRSAIMDTSTNLGFLCDIVAARRPFVFAPAVYSIGDLVMSVGIFIAIIALMRTPSAGEKLEAEVDGSPDKIV